MEIGEQLDFEISHSAYGIWSEVEELTKQTLPDLLIERFTEPGALVVEFHNMVHDIIDHEHGY